MEVFLLTLNQMLVLFIFIVLGFILKKKNILPESTSVTLARLETYLFLPALNFGNMMEKCSVQAFKDNLSYITYGGVLILLAVLIAYPMSHIFVKGSDSNPKLSYQRNVYKYAFTFANYGYVGNFIVLGIWGAEGLFKFQMLSMIPTVVCNTWGLSVLVPAGEKKQSIFKSLLTPPIIALVLGIVAGFLNLSEYIPAFAQTALSNASACMGPVGMVLAGVVIAGYDFKKLLVNKKVYLISLFRLVIIPSVFAGLLTAFGVSKEIITYVLIFFAGPLGLNTIIFPAAYGGDPETGASMAMISHTLSVITIPLMYLVWVG